MFSDLGPLPHLALLAVLGVLGAAAGYWIEKQISLTNSQKATDETGFQLV
jgi:hypothetical protein